jgi:hypothetical protein
MFLFKNSDNFKNILLWQDFNSRAKDQLHFPSVKITSIKKGAVYYPIKVFNHLALKILQLRENKTLIKSALRKYFLTHVFYSVEQLLVYNNDKNIILL